MEALLTRGSLRVGTIFDYRDAGKHGAKVGDPAEGHSRLKGNLVFYDHRFIPYFKTFGDKVVVEGEGESQLRHFSTEGIETPNAFVFSASSEYSESAHRQWLEDKGYDACYLIRSSRLFVRAISRHPDFARAAEFLCDGPAHYYEIDQANIVIDGTFHPALLKLKDGYGDQSEVRAIWKPRDGEKLPLYFSIDASESAKYCEEYRVIGALASGSA